MMAKKLFRKWGLGLCALMTAVVVGCQSVGGLNFDDVILNQLEIESQESSGRLTVEIDWNEEAAEAEADEASLALLPLLSRVEIAINHAATDAEGRTLVEGSIGLGGKKPAAFRLHADEKALLVELEGAKKPLALDLSESAGSVLGELGLPAEQETALAEPMRKLVRTVASYFVHHLPNPPKFEVGLASTQVNGENQTLTKVHAELDGAQLGELVLDYLDALAADKEGFRAMLAEVVSWIKALPPELTDGVPIEDEVTTPEEEKQFIEEGVDELFPLLEEWRADLKSSREEPEWAEIFDKGISLKADFYVDAKLHVRKSDVELTIAPAAFSEPDSPVRSIKIRSASETWNVNGDVRVEPVVVHPLAVDLDAMEEITGIEFLRLFREDSTVYDILKNDAKIDDVSFELDTGWGFGIDPYVEREEAGDVLYVPVRYTLAEFENEVSFGKDRGEIAFTDLGTMQDITLYLGSDDALVNWQKVKLGHPVKRIGSYAYVAADDLFPLLKATYQAEDGGDGEWRVTVKRDL